MPTRPTSKPRCVLPTLLALIPLFGCPTDGPTDEGEVPYDGPPVGLLDDEGIYPYPSIHLMTQDDSTATGWRVDIDAQKFPIPAGGTPLPEERINRLDGFSVANSSVVLLPDADIDPDVLPSKNDLAPSVQPDSPVQIIDLSSGARIPCFAELDAHPNTTGPEDRVLLIRPLSAMAWGTRHAVVLTSALTDRSGSTIPTPERFAALRDGGDVHPGLRAYVDHYESMFVALEDAGVARSEIVLAWDFWTGTEDVVHAHLDQIIDATRADLPADPAHEPDYEVDWMSDTDEGFELGVSQWRLSQGSFELANYLDESGMFTLDENANPVPQDDADVYYMVMVPPSVRDAPAGTVPVVIFGHGIFASPYVYIGKEDDTESVCRLMDRLGAIAIGTKWRGLTTEDMPDAVRVANDFGQFPLITDKLTQAVANAMTLPRLLQTDFAEADVFQARDGSGSLIDPSRIYWYGISTGGIEGAVTMANSEHLQYAVLHVGGSIWSIMLERSSNWAPYENWIEDTVPAPQDRQLLYAVSQLMWDPVDPITHLEDMRNKSLLMQESMGDEQVPNMTTEALARSEGIPLMVPSIDDPYGFETDGGPLGPGSSALMQYDPQLGRQDDANRPAHVNGAHGAIRGTEEVMSQIEAFFTPGQEGTIIHPCDGEPCVFDTD